jgi:hypothetical protein
VASLHLVVDDRRLLPGPKGTMPLPLLGAEGALFLDKTEGAVYSYQPNDISKYLYIKI